MQATDWLRSEARRIRKPLLFSAGLTALQALLLVAQAWLLAEILSVSLWDHATWSSLWRQWLCLFLLPPLRAMLQMRARSLAFDASQDVGAHLRMHLLERVQALGVLGLRSRASGALITGLVDGVDTVLPYFARYLPGAATAVLVPAIVIACTLPADWISGLVLVLCAPMVPLFMVFVGHAAERASHERFEQLRRLGRSFVDVLGGLTTLRQLGAAWRVADELESEGEDYRRISMQVLRIAFLSSLVLEFFATVSIAVVAVLIGFRLLWGDIPFHDGMFVLLLAPELYLPLRALGGLRHARMEAVAAIQGLQTIDGALSASAHQGTEMVQCAGPIATSPEIEFRGVRFAHAGRRLLLDGIDIRLGRGLIALVGESGAGKSTMLDMLLGFATPMTGNILVNGIDIQALDLSRWRARLAWVPQKPHVFDLSLKENLLIANPGADGDKVNRALADSGLDMVASRLPSGMDTRLGENGLGLSGGELQRLALARAFLRDSADLWLLDEPTAHLDAESARSIGRLIRAAAASRVVLMAAHRLDAVMSADHVLVLHDGKIVESGTPRTLLDSGGRFAAIACAEIAG